MDYPVLFSLCVRVQHATAAATVEEVPVKTFVMAWSAMKLQNVDLININIEGIEFDLVQALLDSGVQSKIRNLRKAPPPSTMQEPTTTTTTMQKPTSSRSR